MLTKSFNQLSVAFLKDFQRAFPDEATVSNALAMVQAIVKCNESSPLPLMAFTNGETESLARLDRTLFEIPGMRMEQLASQLTATNRAALEAHLSRLEELAMKQDERMGELNARISEARQSDAYTAIEDMIKNPQQILTTATDPQRLAAFGEIIQQNKALQDIATDLQTSLQGSDDAQRIIQQAQTTVEGLVGSIGGAAALQKGFQQLVSGEGGGEGVDSSSFQGFQGLPGIEEIQQGMQQLMMPSPPPPSPIGTSSNNKRKRRPIKRAPQ